MRRVLPVLLSVLLAAGNLLASGPERPLGRIQGMFARPPQAGDDLLSRFQQYQIASNHAWNAGRFVNYSGPFGQTMLEVRDSAGRYTGELDSFAQKYEIRDTLGHTIGWFDSWGAFAGELLIEDPSGRRIGRLRRVFNDGSLIDILGDSDCVALFARLGIQLSPIRSPGKQDAERQARFEKLHAQAK